jgi:hypothetical protein
MVVIKRLDSLARSSFGIAQTDRPGRIALSPQIPARTFLPSISGWHKRQS